MYNDYTNTRLRVSFRSAFRFRGASLAVLALSALAAAPALGASVRVAAGQDPSEVSSFALNFGEFGGVASALIARTDFELEIDTAARTARFNRYDQDIDPLMLPGGISTGNIRVEVVPNSSTGAFNPATGEFATSEVYAIHFDGDLSAFNLHSPVLLESNSSGIVALEIESGGSVVMEWSGGSELANPFDPTTLIPFTYTCVVNAAFAAAPTNMLELNLKPYVLNLTLPQGLENSLIRKLDMASEQIGAGRVPGAIRSLRAFINKVEAQQGKKIGQADADALIASAEATITLLLEGDLGNAGSSISSLPSKRAGR
ncbi:MAG: hypothetical protein Q7R41_05020 [Phycisphaerales bacterium]|nr:hypothetical protein [Phycisphaerales bacterium]